MAVTEPSLSVGRPLRLRANVVWTLAGNVVYAASQWGIVAVLAKLGSASIVGQYALGLAIAAPVYMLLNLQLRSVQATDVADQFRFADYLGLRLAANTLGLIVVAVLCFGIGLDVEAAAVVVLVGVVKWVENMSDVVHGRLQKVERMDLIAHAVMMKGPFGLVAMSVTFTLTQSLAWSVAALALAWGAVGVIVDLRNAARHSAHLRPTWDPSVVKRLVLHAAPLGVVMMLISLNGNVPRYFLEGYEGEEAVGYYSAIIYLLAIGMTVVGALGQAATPRLARYVSEGRTADFGRLLLTLMALAAAIALAGVSASALMGEQVLTWLYTAEYAQFVDELTLAMALSGVVYAASILGFGMTAAQQFRAQVPIFGLSLLGVAGASALLIPSLSVRGGIWAVGVGAGIQLLGATTALLLTVRRSRAVSIA